MGPPYCGISMPVCGSGSARSVGVAPDGGRRSIDQDAFSEFRWATRSAIVREPKKPEPTTNQDRSYGPRSAWAARDRPGHQDQERPGQVIGP